MIVPKRVLVIQTAFIGDAILATALLERIHQAFPATTIEVLVRKGNEELFSNHPYLGTTLIWDKKREKYAGLLKLLKCIRKRRYDWVINLQRFASTGFLTAFSGAEVRIGFDKNPLSFLFSDRTSHEFGNGIHEVDRNGQLLTDLVPAGINRPRLYPSVHDYEQIRQYQAKGAYICLAPASVWFTKQYPAERWIQLISKLAGQYEVYLLGGPGDRALVEAISAAFPEGRVNSLCGSLSLLESAALMQGAAMNFVNDSAPMHLCSSVNAPVTVVYCSTVPDFGYGPLSDISHVIEIEKPLACRPCGIHGHSACPEKHFRCAYDIRLQQLTEVLPV